jgi:predicted N-acyltransferase
VFATFAEDDQNQPLAGSLFLTAGNQLFGRYWGALGHFDCLHFELCYYLPIEWALTHNIDHFEAGAQGEHKLKRGFLPVECHSSHFIRHAGLASAIAEFLPREAEGVGEEIDYYQGHSPFRHEPQSDD